MAEVQEVNRIIENQNSSKQADKKSAELLNRYFRLIVFLAVIVVLAVGYWLVLAPKWEIKIKKNQNLSALQDSVNKLKADSDFLSQYSSKIIDFTPTEERQLSLALPDEFDLPSIIVQLTKLASDYKFIVEDIQVEEVGANGLADKNIKRVDIEISVSGVGGNDYGNFSKLIEALESSLMIFDVKAISFTPQEVGYKLELSTYYYAKKQ